MTYKLDGEKVIDFKMVVADWGSSTLGGGKFFGGTPVYAGPRTFDMHDKDLFSFGRMAMELFMNKPGTESKHNLKTKLKQLRN